jgi:hypothetical protein
MSNKTKRKDLETRILILEKQIKTLEITIEILKQEKYIYPVYPVPQRPTYPSDPIYY